MKSIHTTSTRKADYIISDRIDLQIEVQPVNFDELADKTPGESSESIRQRVIQARALQNMRFQNTPGIHCNAQMTTAMLHQWAEPDREGVELLRNAIERMNMSARAYDRISASQRRLRPRKSTRWLVALKAAPRCSQRAHIARHTTPSARWHWWAAALTPRRAKSVWRTMGCCFSTNFPNLTAQCLR